MTEAKKFIQAGAALQRGTRASAFQKGQEAVALAEYFTPRGIHFGGNGRED